MADEVGGQPTPDDILSQHNQPAAAPAPEATPAEPAFDPQQFGYTFRNETVYPKDRNEMIETLQLGRSFRENKEKWEQERQRLSTYESRKDDYQRYDLLRDAIQKNPQFASELQALAEKYSGQPQGTSQIPPEIETLQRRVEEMEARRADEDLRQELDALEQKNPHYDWKSDTGEGTLRSQLVRFMGENKIYDSQKALRAMMYDTDMQRAKLDAEKKAADELAKRQKLGVVPAGTQQAPVPQPKSVDHRADWGDLTQQALEEFSAPRR